MTKRILIFGFGYCAKALVFSLNNKEWELYVVTRNINNIKSLTKKGIAAVHWSDRRGIGNYIRKADTVLLCVPPAGFFDPVKEEFSLLFSDLQKKSKIIYLSSTGVYGDHRGNWVDEKSDLNPTTDLGLRRLYTERLWEKFSKDLRKTLIIIRLAGIYGPGRSPIDKLAKGKANIVSKPEILFSRIHIDDIVEIIKLCVEKDDVSGIYNLCDHHPASQGKVMEEACRLFGCDTPKPVSIKELNLSKTALGFYSESKKVCNKKLLKDFGYKMIHPDYFSGLKAIVEKAGNSDK